MQNKIFKDTTNTKKHYDPPKLLIQDHMTRVTQKTSGGDDGSPGNLRKDKDNLIPDVDSNEGSSGGGSGELFDNPFDD